MNFIKKINTYLLEHYPTIWNTRLVWMLGVGIITHLFFFVIGYFTVENQIDIQSEYRLNSFFFGTPVVFLNVLLSIAILLVWIIYYLQNNAFKNLYALKKGTLFGQLGIILVIFFINITQYYSFNEGLKLKIRNLYSWEEIDKDIKEFNKTSVFLIQEKSDYEIHKKKYPNPFPLEYQKTDKLSLFKMIDTSKAYFNYDGKYYQFYKEMPQKTAAAEVLYADEVVESVYDRNYFKYRDIKDVSAFKEDVNTCLVNYSDELYKYGQDSLEYENRLKYYEELFNRGDENEIKEKLQSFFRLAKKYQVNHNLNIDEWYGLLNENNYEYKKVFIKQTASENIYEIKKVEKERKNYVITQFILRNEPTKWNSDKSYYWKKTIVEKRLIDKQEYKINSQSLNNRIDKTYSIFEETSLSSKPYCDFGNLDKFFKNVHEAYHSKETKEIIYVYIIISLILGLLLFLFKITDIRTLLLSFVAAIVVLIVVGVSMSYIPYTLKDYFGSSEIEYLIATMAGLGVITCSLLSLKLRWKKLITAILFSLSIFAIPLTLIFIFNFYKDMLGYKERIEDEFYLWVEEYVFWMIITVWIIGIVYYTKAIRKWKGLPE